VLRVNWNCFSAEFSTEEAMGFERERGHKEGCKRGRVRGRKRRSHTKGCREGCKRRSHTNRRRQRGRGTPHGASPHGSCYTTNKTAKTSARSWCFVTNSSCCFYFNGEAVSLKTPKAQP
jgi:hypothetical protein